MGRVTLIGLDCGSTTTCLVVAVGQLTTGVQGRVEVTQLDEVFRSPTVFTPFAEQRIDAERLSALIDGWLREARVGANEIFSGGALITGLAAARENAASIRDLLAERLQDAVVAAADAPRLEAWLAFMGNCHTLSQANAETPVLNVDIGGGTTNLALGQAGQVIATGALFVGARHLQFEPGTYRLAGHSSLGGELLRELHIHKRLGDVLTRAEVDQVARFYAALLAAVIEDDQKFLQAPLARQHVQAPLKLPEVDRDRLALTLSGGVGQLAYHLRAGGVANKLAEFGDLGGELAEAILACPSIADRLTLTPEGLGHATVFGLLRHSTELSGTTLYLPHPERLPLADVPLVGSINTETPDARLAELLALVTVSGRAAALRVDLAQQEPQSLRQLGELLTRGLAAHPLPQGTTLVLLVEANLGKTLGHLVTRWGKLDVDLIVLDEVPPRDAQLVRVGRLRESVVPLSLYAVR